jgi:glutaredoxin
MVQLVSRDACHLCENAERELANFGIAYERLDVDRDSELERLYTFRVPVLIVEGVVTAEGILERPLLLRLAEGQKKEEGRRD